MKIKFINHASYIVETDDVLLLHDPWLEGNAFNNGWALLSKEVSNKNVIDYLSQSDKSINIWISHEHPDHFSISFIKHLKASGLKCKFFFQKTTDKRVYKYLKINNFDVTECADGEEYELGKNFFLSVFPFLRNDSFCFLRTDTKNILNTNDCTIRDEQTALKTLKRLSGQNKVDILFTQFGYAHRIGRKEDFELRIKMSIEKFSGILVQDKVFNPEIIIPFASFVYFCKEDNFYMNDEQNSPGDLRQSDILSGNQEKINFMKPMQMISLDDNSLKNLQINTKEAEEYWNALMQEIKHADRNFFIKEKNPIGAEEILRTGKEFISKIRLETLGFVCFFEILKMSSLRPIVFHVYDLDICISLSYIKGIKYCDVQKSSVSIHSSELAFILKNEFGWDTLHISGAFRAVNSSIDELNYFFRWQTAIKNGFSFRNPVHTLRVLISLIHKRICKLVQYLFNPEHQGLSGKH